MKKIYLERNEDGAWVNIPCRCHQDATLFDWGNLSPETHDLAVNILHWALSERGVPNRITMKCQRGGEAFMFAHVMQADFTREVLAHLPYEGGSLDLDAVQTWIDLYPQFRIP